MVTTPSTPSSSWQQGEAIELTIHDLSDRGDGVGRFEGRAVFVPDTVTGDRVAVRLVRVKPKYGYGKLLGIIEPSPHRISPSCIVADKCGGCQWQHVSDDYQREAKHNLVVQAMARIGGFSDLQVEPVLIPDNALHYRNKSTYPVALAENQGQRRSKQALVHGRVVAGYYQKGSHHIVNLNQCPIQDQRLDSILAAVKQDIQAAKWPIYDEQTHKGSVRHISLRVGRRTGEILLTIVVKDPEIKDLWQVANAWSERFGLVGVCLNINPDKTNAIFGEATECIVGREYLTETFAGLTFQVRPETFFQVYTEQAEAIALLIRDELQLTGDEIILDAYCGIGTLTLPLAQQSMRVIGIEVQGSAIAQARINAKLNEIENVEFHVGTVEALLGGFEQLPDMVVLDPPRKGCDPQVIGSLLAMNPQKIAYMSCNPATLARDLKQLCADGRYRLEKVQPVDFFPQTSHIEAVAFLRRVLQSETA
ncbi:23S rRNA (uracil(1939)-C(5))-methyltransferase RlmD [filamentous cyanobacterium LEGE 11480]|uniref:23S rRNA (Uracil(1939)-C(5))-methyltransferase RlmD n=1 Tax=Romeriopsis navalis LEGE 11480 TaxID=2777977 RepID=A0A928Z2Y4_9CYAN|nr:23S rRNA (uracil(1939)-C(5))-methyltransferase RlmD [Romeriopsis navalis]MBE9029522.1 23S rRNA (uracil(1939)-C(5))-methyltransferase RlmD [Romeriopsis navalis LEGE 11480]